MFEWTEAKKLLFTEGHTYGRMFGSYSKTFQLFKKELELKNQLNKITDIGEIILIKEVIKRIEQIISGSKEELQKDKIISRWEGNPVLCY